MTTELARIAKIYNDACTEGRAPTRAVAESLGTSRSVAGNRVMQARRAGLLPPTEKGKRFGAINGNRHRPKAVRWSDGSESWLACETCRRPWPCR